ncbi:DUF4232 domain-containing protein [Saccharothrix xinjiangensis]|uniref:DUF4232 domain-containing protein n=1 Tax=Saccharothrix xinjiangensis TaxID=204798 RepID=A0ABV9Y357_9PSEU
MRRGVAVLVAVTTAIALVGCSSGTSKSSRSSKAGSTAGKSTATKKTTKKDGDPDECATLGVSTGGVRTDGGQRGLPLVFTNEGDRTCTVTGFPGVRLDGVDGASWDVTRRDEQARPVTLGPGQQAVANLALGPQPGNWEVRALVVTPPGASAAEQLPWSAGPLVLQDGATRPATHVGPVTPKG